MSAVDKAGNEGPADDAEGGRLRHDGTHRPGHADHRRRRSRRSSRPISWTATTDPGGSGVASYTVYRDGVQIAAAAVGTSYQDTALAANGTYAYAIRANDAAGQRLDA